MQETEIMDINDFCFKIILDYKSIDLDFFLDKLSEIGDIIFLNGYVYVWLFKGNDKRSLLLFMKRLSKRLKFDQFFISALSLGEVVGRNDFLEKFIQEHIFNLQMDILEENRQEELKRMLLNIEKAEKLLVENKNKEEA